MKSLLANLKVLVILLGFSLFAAFSLSCGGGGGNSTPPPPAVTLTSMSVTAASAAVTVGQTDQLTATGTYSDSSKKDLTSSATWSSSATSIATVNNAGLVTGVAGGTATITATSGSVSGTVSITVNTPTPTATLTAAPTSITANLSSTLTWSCTNATSATGSWGGFLPTSGSYPFSPTTAGTYTFTLACTGAGGSANASATVTVSAAPVSLGFDPSADFSKQSNEIYLKNEAQVAFNLDCSGCQPGYEAHSIGVIGLESKFTWVSGSVWQLTLNYDGLANVPGASKAWITNSNNAPQSNVLWILYRGNQNMAVRNPNTGEIYFRDAGNGTSGSAQTLKFKSDGTPDGSLTLVENEGVGNEIALNGIAVDDQTGYVFAFGLKNNIVGLVNVYDPVGGTSKAIFDANPLSLTDQLLGIDAKGGLVCAAQPDDHKAYCFQSANALTSNPTIISLPLPTTPAACQPMALKVLDNTHVVVYDTANQMLEWFTISGTSATASGTLALQDFTPTDPTFWSGHIGVGGWFIVQVGSTLGVMGQVVNADDTVEQELALVNNNSTPPQQIGSNITLPKGTVLIAADPANTALAIEYPDFTSSPPITRFARIDLSGNLTNLTATSNLTPAVGFVTTKKTADGDTLGTFLLGQGSFQPNQ